MKNYFDGALRHGPATFVRLTGRDKVWSAKPPPLYELHGRACPCCGSLKAKLLFVKQRKGDPNVEDDPNTWDYHQCEECGMVYTGMAPSPRALEAMYQRGPSQQQWVELQQNKVEAELDALKFRWALTKAGWPRGNNHILDIGCSTGALLSVAEVMARPARRFLCGVEINSAALQVAGARLSGAGEQDRSCSVIVTDNLDAAKNITRDGKPTKFDVVSLWEVLEHVRDPKEMLAEAWDLVAPGGQLMICVPNWGSLAVRVMRERATCFGAGHLNFWDHVTLRQTFESAIGSGTSYDGPAFETIISYQKEIANYLEFREPMSYDNPGSNLVPSVETIHKQLLGYKLVMFVGKLKDEKETQAPAP